MNGCDCILFWIDVYFTEYLLAVEIDEKGHIDRKKLGYKFIRINKIKEDYDADYEASRIQTFISKFRDRQLKKLYKKLKELGDKIKELTS